MDQLIAMRAFRQVAELASFSAAAEKLNMSNGAVSKHVSALENHLGVQLLVRTTRYVGLTDSGRSYLERCARILDDIGESEIALSRHHTTPRGTLRVNAPVSFAILHLGALFAEFLQRYPEIQLDLNLNDRFVDPVEEGFDMVIRIIRQLPDSNLIARKLADIDYVICAAPSYLKRAGTPRIPEDLASHECLLYVQGSPHNELRLQGPTGEWRVKVPPARYSREQLARRVSRTTACHCAMRSSRDSASPLFRPFTSTIYSTPANWRRCCSNTNSNRATCMQSIRAAATCRQK